jgi:S1-C subfamily serine protease
MKSTDRQFSGRRPRAFAGRFCILLAGGWLVGLGVVCGGATDQQPASPVVRAVQKAMPSVVNIGTERMVKITYHDPFQRLRSDLIQKYFEDYHKRSTPPGYKMAHSLGSGVVVHSLGYILTNYHVLEQAARIRVALGDDQVYDAELIAADDVSDLALIRVLVDRPQQAVAISANDPLWLGEQVIVLGNPYGLSHSVTVGVLSARDREAVYDGKVLYRDILQTDAAVNPGSSGGPLLNAAGELIGVNVAIYQDAQNIGFAIPYTRVRRLLTRWLSPRKLNDLLLGMALEDREQGLSVLRVEDHGPAAKAGIEPGDRIIEVAGSAVPDLLAFNVALLAYAPGDDIPIQAERDGAGAQVVLRPDNALRPPGQEVARNRLGLEVSARDYDEESLRMGVPVTKIHEKGPSAELGIEPGFYIIRIDDVEINSPADIGLALEDVPSGQKVSLAMMEYQERKSFMMATRRDFSLEAQ